MSLDANSRGAGLSPSKRALLERMLKGKAHEAPVLTIPRRPRTEGSPLSFAQQRLWFIHQIDPASPAYNVPIALRLRGRLDREVLHRCLAEVARRHESLRTRFETKAGSPAQVIEADARLELPVVDLAHLPASARELEAQRLAGEEASAPFDLERGPLIRARLLRLAAEDHVFLLGMHHIVSDGWSMGVLVREVAALYEAFVAGRPSPLPDLPIQYADFAAWQRDALSGARLEGDLAYWRARLRPLPTALDLAADRPRPSVQTFRGGVERVTVPADVANRMRALTRREGATLFMGLLAAFDALLARLASEDDITVGTGLANRTLPELEPLVGFFVNTLVIRASCAGDPSFRELLGRVREATLGAFSHQDLPFERLVEELQPARDLSRNPLFQVAFALQNAPLGGFELPGLSIDPVPAETGATRFDLEFHLWEEAPGGGLDGYLFYSADLFDAPTVRLMAQRYLTLLAAAVAAPERRLSELPLLTQEEDRQLIAWNQTREGYSLEACAHTLFESQAGRTPDALAVQMEHRRLTYRELNERANQLAHVLRRNGVGPDRIVGIFMERSLEMVVALLGIHKAGGAYLPLDPSYPKARLAFMLRDARARLLVTQTRLRGNLPEADVLALDPDEALLEGESRAAVPLGGALKENLAYVLYTSGSTGNPRGVMVSHGALSNHMQWMARAFPLAASDAVLQRTSPSFDASIWEFFAPLISGARLFLAAEGAHHDASYLIETIRRHSITTLQMVPSLLSLLLEGEGVRHCRSLKRVFCGGESLSPELRDRFFDLLPADLHNLYGPTEATIDATSWSCGRSDTRRVVPIGRPIANFRAHVLDSHLRAAPVGVAGELHLAGTGLARGYLGDPALTAERFIPNPFAGEPGARLYRTGDAARRLADGAIEYLGRKDRQVKLRGLRIEPGEIESALAEHPAVLKAVVIVLEDDPLPVKGPGFEPVDEESGGGRRGGAASRLAAYLVLRTGEALSADALRSFLAGRLPRFMIPSIFQTLPSLPLTPNGKIDRRALRELGRAAPPPGGAVAPRTPAEREVARVWKEVLGVQEVGATDNFFDLGGHSLLATQVIARLRAALAVEVPLRAIFEAPTVESLAAFIEQARVAGGVSTHSGRPPTPGPVRRIDRKGPLPLSFAQQRLWFLDKLQPGSAAYNIPCLLRLEGSLDVAALSRALTEIIRRHEVLRTHFVEGPQGPEQVIDASWELRLVAERMETSDPVEAARRLFETEALRPFDLALGPLLRVRLIRLAENDYAFLLTLHHVVSDGWSMGVLVRELAALYEAYAAGGESPLAELPIQYSDFAVWQRETLVGERLEREIAFWRERLSPLPPPLPLPADHPRPAVQSFRGGGGQVSIPGDIAEAIRSLAREEGATLFMVLLAAFEALLVRLTGETDIAVGTGIANRTRVELEPLIGFFVNTLVLRVDCSGDPTFRELLGRVREVTLEAYAHQDLPVERLVEELQPARDLNRNPIFQVAFVLQNTPSDVFELPGLSIAPFPFDGWTTRFDLEFHLWEEAGGGLGGFLFYSADLFDDTTIRRLIDRYAGLLRSVAEDPACRLSDLPVATADELRVTTRVLARGADLPVTPEPVHELFARQAAHTPDAPALVEGTRRLTYSDLDAASARLASRLRREGVGRGSRVAVLADRSLEQVTAILGVARAGAAYVPLDPGNPDRRIASLLERSGARVVIAPSALAARARRAGGIVIEPEAEETTDAGPGGPFPAGSPADLAYVIFTSGSTGEPNGVEVSHASLSNLVAWHRDAFGVTGTDRATLVAGVGFDASVWELWPALASGACLLIPDDSTRLDPKALRDWIVAERVTIAFLPTPLAELVLALDWPPCVLRTLLTGGDRLHAIRTARLPFRVVNNYGPTEATVVATSGEADAGASLGVPTIGRPIANTRAYVLDPGLRPVPIGVSGELWIGGHGVARGYAGRPQLTAERFLPDPFAGEPAARMYRTGDRVRLLADGRFEFSGRVDAQVKVRGHRIEPGEVEAVLARHPGVEAAAVVAREENGEMRLVAYVTPRRAAGERGAWEEEHIARWRDLYDATYGRTPEGQDASFNITGWNSSYTGEPIPPEEMREWRDHTVRRILDLAPRRVLEIGCGTGLLLTQLAPRCERYVATDFSRVSLDLVRRIVADRVELAHVELHERMADDFDVLEPASFDTVVLNSVVQYFPDADYLERVLRGALRRVADGGRLFVGDVRDARLHGAFAASVALHAAPASMSAATARAAARRMIANEEELLVSPAFFATLAAREGRGAWAEALLKRGRADNELTRFRYDAVLHVGSAASRPAAREIAWSATALAALEETLCSDGDQVVVRGVPNARVAAHLASARALDAAGDGETAGAVRDVAHGSDAVHPDDAAALGGPGWVAAVGLSGEGEDTFDVAFARAGIAGACAALALRAPADDVGAPLTNLPLRTTIVASLAPAVREFAAGRLPEAMVPSSIVVLEALPLTPNGKVDRRALPTPESAIRSGESLAPRDDLERTLAALWADILGGGGDDIEENFFLAGGNSLMAVRLVGSICRELSTELPVAALFREPTIAGLARLLRGAALDASPLVTLKTGDGLPPLVCVHEVGGGISAFAALAGDLDPRRPVLGIHAFGEAPSGRIEDTAAGYTGLVARAVPEGPVDLLGWSYGGLVAYEMALRLREAGRDVRTLVLLDVPAPIDGEQEGPGRARAARALWGIEVEEGNTREAIAAARAVGALLEELDGEQAAAWLVGVATRMDAAESYHPRPYEGKVVLVRGTESDIDRAGDDTLGWRRFVTGSLALEWAPGSHYSIVRGDGARTIAAIVERHAARTGSAEGLVEKLETMPDEEARRRMERDTGFVQRVSDER